MAYTKKLGYMCEKLSCDKGAVLEVFNSRNALLGRYCRKDAAIRLRDQKLREGVGNFIKGDE